MSDNIIKQTYNLGQSIWLDFIDRKLIQTGELEKLIADGLKGMTSNPAIFEKAISNGDQYNEQIHQLSESMSLDGQVHDSADKVTDEEIFYNLAIDDIQAGADLLKVVYDEKIKGADGYISLEVSPRLARDTTGTITQARLLWEKVARNNVMIKIPATIEGLPAIREMLSEGLNINVTLLFGLDRYQQVIEAYISGLEDRVKAGAPVDGIASVASFFLSRIDVLLKPVLQENNMAGLDGQVAIALAKKAYQIYKTSFTSDRWKLLAEKGARPQRLLWASTGSKDPSFSDTKYVDALIGKDTVNTLPMETYLAFLDHGKAEETLELDLLTVDKTLNKLTSNGIDMGSIALQLENEGIEKFLQPYDKLLKAIREKRREIVQI